MEDWHAHRQADESMAVNVGLAIMLGMVIQEGNTIKVLAPLGNSRVVHAEEDRFTATMLPGSWPAPAGPRPGGYWHP